MPMNNRDRLTEIQDELLSLRTELEVIETWDRLFGPSQANADSYLARQRRRWELALRIKDLEKQIASLQLLVPPAPK